MKTYKGFQVGKEYRTKVVLPNEDGQLLPSGTGLRIVAITPKVRMTKADGIHNDGLEYFYNAVQSTESDWWENYHGRNKKNKPIGRRIRANFCTLLK